MENYSKQKWEDLNLSQDELKSIGEALKKEEFRNLLVEYVKEINDPENRKQYEKEITQLEQERGVDVKFVHPSAGYVIKTSVDGKSKAFINICSNINVGEPSSVPDVREGHKGLRWSLPYCLAPPREDSDQKNNSCMVFDVVFHPDTLHMSKSNTPFKKLVEDTALGAVEEAYKVTLDKINLKYPKMQFKGAKHPTVIRKKIKDFQPTELLDFPNYPYPSPNEKNEEQKASKAFQKIHKTDCDRSKENLGYTTPKYTIKYRNNIDMQDFTNDPMTKMSASVPSELVIVIDLPLLKHSSDASIDVTGNSVLLISESPAKYKLSLNLPYIVNDLLGNAKFDTVKKTLTVTLPVCKQKICSNIDNKQEDSGVESDDFNGRSNSTSSCDDVTIEEKHEVKKNSHELNIAFDETCQNANSDCTTTQSCLKPNIHYCLPNYSCQLFGDVLSSTLQVPNVNPESLEYQFIEKSDFSGFCLSFFSTGSGFFPVNYGICVLLPSPCKIDKDSFKVEVWDNNMIAQIKLILSDDSSNRPAVCYIGSDENRLDKVAFSISDFIDTKLSSDEDKENQESVSVVVGNGKEEEDNTELVDEDKEGNVSLPETRPSFEQDSSLTAKRLTLKSRTVSECHQSDFGQSKSRGILKIGRSLSESSVDDYASWSTEKEKTKKTVRFSEVITKQTFRMNSSILGQRKKNQRKSKNKKRALERRLSESGNESEGETEIFSMKGKDQFNCNREIDVWCQEPDSSSCETSEISEASDVSESEDGLKEDVKAFLPCSSKRNHKRRGKKSARKNAATAKFQFMEN